MRHRTITNSAPLLAAAGVLCAVCTLPSTALAAAVAVPTPPNPNVLLLIDTSGSMEDWPDATQNHCGSTETVTSGTEVTTAATTDTVCYAPAAAGPNKWGSVIEALAGSLPFDPAHSALQPYAYYEMPRNAGTPFDNEYTINDATNSGKHIYDVGYSLNFHRPLAWDSTAGSWCALGPAKLAGAPAGGGIFRGVPAGDPSVSADNQNYGAMLAGVTPAGIEAYTTSGVALFPSCNFKPAGDGNIDAARDLVRFGLMTFDSDTAQGTGVTPTAGTPTTFAVQSATPWLGLWSYYPGWDGNMWTSAMPPANETLTHVANTAALLSPYATGPGFYSVGTAQPVDTGLSGCLCVFPAAPGTLNPAACPWEVGARNPAAPPWEGRMVPFPDGRAPLSAQESTNDAVKTVLAASRPYGATPIAGMLEDSRNYFRLDPTGPEKSDPFVNSTSGTNHGCRPQFQILLTDGAANLDLRSSGSTTSTTMPCEPNPAGGKSSCPFQHPGDIAKDMALGGSPNGSFDPVSTFVIGFGVETVSGSAANCKSFVAGYGGQNAVCTNAAAQTACANPTTGSALDACCNLISIACNGTSNTSLFTTAVGPYFADSAADLDGAFSSILGSIARSASAHVVPVFATAYSSSGQEAFAASFKTASSTVSSSGVFSYQPWSGDIARSTTTCTSATPTIEHVGTDLQAVGSTGRQFLTATLSTTGSVDDTLSLRPFQPASVADGFIAAATTQERLVSAANLNTAISASDLPVSGSACPSDPTTGSQLSAAQCYQYSLDFLSGRSDPASLITVTSPSGVPGKAGNTYKPTDRITTPLGPIINSTPQYSARPSGNLSDNTYRAYVDTFFDAMGVPTRPNVIYVNSTDGALHAFGADYISGSTGLTSTLEEWSFIPPAVVPSLATNLPSAAKTLLDGSPIVQDTVWERAVTVGTGSADWHTTLVSGFGAGGRGYFALDVSQPAPTGWTAESPSASGPVTRTDGPHFLWQLTTLDSTKNALQLFASHGATPAITTMFVNGEEVGVAILPGGSDGQAPTGTCSITAVPSMTANDYIGTSGFKRRTMVRSWSAPATSGNACNAAAPVSGRSVTIVRIKDGLVLATFINGTDFTAMKTTGGPYYTQSAASLKGHITNFDSPMIGTPVAYPSGVGKLTKAVYISDADGILWKIDVSSSDPANWKAGQFFDAFNTGVMTLSAVGSLSAAQVEADTAQPFTGPPILSIGRTGELVLNFATGDQTLFTTKTFAAGSNNTVNDELPEWNFVWSVSDINNAPVPNWYVPFAPSGAISPQYNHGPSYNTACNKGDSTCTGGASTYSTLSANNTGERVTGPMTVFDGVLYFATLKPADDIGQACALAETRIYGMDYQKLNTADDTQFTNGTACTHMNEVGVPDIGCGGAYRLPVSAAGPATQHPQYDRPADGNAALEGTLIPGVAITQNQSCFSTSTGADNYFGNPASSYQTLTQPQTPVLTYLATTNSSGTLTGTAATSSPIKMKINPPTRATRIDSWAGVID